MKMHTPGPWTRFILRRGEWIAQQVNVPQHQVVRHADPEWGEDAVVHVPNVTAAGALALLEALRGMLDTHSVRTDEGGAVIPHYSDGWMEKRRAAVAAIAKAEGRD